MTKYINFQTECTKFVPFGLFFFYYALGLKAKNDIRR